MIKKFFPLITTSVILTLSYYVHIGFLIGYLIFWTLVVILGFGVVSILLKQGPRVKSAMRAEVERTGGTKRSIPFSLLAPTVIVTTSLCLGYPLYIAGVTVALTIFTLVGSFYTEHKICC